MKKLNENVVEKNPNKWAWIDPKNSQKIGQKVVEKKKKVKSGWESEKTWGRGNE